MNSVKDLVSIIVPVYNVEQYLDRCMHSIINQTYSNLEIVLIDDGSTDKSGELCDQWAEKDARIKVVHKKNEGQAKARNVGLDLISGEYVGYVDSDDWIESDMFMYLYTMINEYDVDVAFCDHEYSRREKKNKHKQIGKECVSVLSDRELNKQFYRIEGGKSSHAVWGGLYRFECIKDVRFLEGHITEDILYRYEVNKKVGKIAFSNLKKYYYFVNSQGTTISKLSKKDLSLFKIWDIIVEKEKGNENYQYALLNRMRATYTLYVKYLLKGNNDVDENEIKQWKSEIKKNYKLLNAGNALDWKRKLVLFFIRYL